MTIMNYSLNCTKLSLTLPKYFVFLLWLNFLSSPALGRGGHVCHFDEMNMDAPKELPIVEELLTRKSGSWMAYTVATADDWMPIRILVSTVDADSGVTECKMNGDKPKPPPLDATNAEKACHSGFAFTHEKRIALKRILRSAAKMHEMRLKVKRIPGGFKMPKFTNPYCLNVTVPESHRSTGVMNADLVLYVAKPAPLPPSAFAFSALCAKLSDHRPVAGAITFNPLFIEAAVYNVRVTAHEIAHVLGFAYNPKMVELLKIANKSDVRGKSRVVEVRGTTTVAKTREHFACSAATGMELEDESVVPHAPLYSHWERRNAKDELMAGIVGRAFYTSLTIAAFTDMGFYQGLMENAEKMDYGANAGCDFLNKPCISGGNTPFPNVFCTSEKHLKARCASNIRGMEVCVNIKADNSLLIWKDTLDTDDGQQHSPLAYYSSESAFKRPKHLYVATELSLRGGAVLVDGCPAYEGHVEGDCRSEESFFFPGLKGPDSWCLNMDPTSSQIGVGHTGMCASVKKEKDEMIVTYEDGKKGTCKDGKVTLEGDAYAGVVLQCLSEAQLTSSDTAYESVLLSEDSGSGNKGGRDVAVRLIVVRKNVASLSFYLIATQILIITLFILKA